MAAQSAPAFWRTQRDSIRLSRSNGAALPKKRALITGVTGQDGSYLTEHLLGLGYDVHGLVRRVASPTTAERFARIHHVLDRLTLHPVTLESYASTFEALRTHSFDECYHLAGQSSVANSFADEFTTMNANVDGTHNLLAAIRATSPSCRFFFAGSSEMFGDATEHPQNERTCLRPRSIYGVSKVAGFNLTRYYRNAYGMFACGGILFNHESPRRGEEFVTRKITRGVALIRSGKETILRLGNLDARRDWGHAADYVRAMHLMLQQSEPGDYVIATGRLHSVRDFCERAFAACGLDYRNHVEVDPAFFRPVEVHVLVGDSAEAAAKLGWRASISFEDLVDEMVRCDLALAGCA